MRLGITAKLFSVILATNIVMTVAFGIALEVSVRHGFREYVKEREQRRLSALSQALAAEYSARGDWQFLKSDPERWTALVQSLAELPPGDVRRRGPPQGGRLPLPRRDGAAPRRFFDGVSLEDSMNAHVAGDSVAKGDAFLEQSVISNGATVGWLRVPQPPMMGTDSRFLEGLLSTAWIVAGLALMLAAIVALPMATRLIAPIRRLATATQRLSAGEFDQRVAVRSRDELGQLTRDFNGLAATLAQAEQARREFLADISHELRTPLAVLKGEVDALRDGVSSPSPEAIESLRAEVATLEHLVNDLYELAVSDLGRDVYHLEKVNLAALAAEAAEGFRERMAGRNLVMDVSGIASKPILAQVEPRRLMQVLNNLLENSLRYTDPGGRVALSVREEGGNVVIAVMDTAPGVPEAMRPKLFDRLFRVEPSRSREFGGAGLGLALCRSIVRAHRGEIVAKESSLGGLWIEVRLPCDMPEAPQ